VTCFLCSASATGVCTSCAAATCAVHGHGRCVDCVTESAARVALSAGPLEFDWPVGAFDARLVDDMHHALKQFAAAPSAVLLQVGERLQADGAVAVVQRLREFVRTIEPPSDPSRDRAEYALGVLAAAFAARGAWSLERSIFHVPGGLQMPALVIMLSTMLVVQLELVGY
jgi:hypothetical protein